MSGIVVPQIELPEGWERWPEPKKRALTLEVKMSAFRLRYRNNRPAFVRDCFRWEQVPEDGPIEYQEWALAQLDDKGRVAMRGPHGLGKTSTAAWAIIHFALTRDGVEDWKNPSTADVGRQLREYLWPEVHKWCRLLRWELIGRAPFVETEELQDMAIRGKTGAAFAASPGNASAIEGAHADQVFFVYDEAKEIDEDLFDATEGAFSTAGTTPGREAFAMAISTPGRPEGRFFQICSKAPGLEDWSTRHVKLQEAIDAGRISTQWAEARKRQWGEDSAIYKNRVLGEFASSAETNVVPLEWVELAQERWRELAVRKIGGGWEIPEEVLEALGFVCVAMDVAEQGGDRTVVALRFGDVVAELREFPFELDVMQATGRVKGILRKWEGRRAEREPYAIVDAIGLGAGPTARLREDGHKVVAFKASEGSSATDSSGELEFLNKRAEAWWGVRELLDPTNAIPIALPAEGDEADLMIGDLTAPKWNTTSAGKIVVESKDDLRKRLKRSTDHGDAIVMALWRGARVRAVVSNPSSARIPGVKRR